MFRFVALFALVAVTTAEPQWPFGYAPAMDATHMKTASGDTVSVAAKKAEHHQLKATEYAKKGYAFGYIKPVVVAATPVASYAAPVAYTNTYAAGIPYGLHHLGKREAEADSQYVYNAGVYSNGYNGYIPKIYNTVASPVVCNNAYNGEYNGVYNRLYNTYAGIHHLGKREAEADSQYVYNARVYSNGYNGYIPKVYNTVASPVVYNNAYNGVYNGVYNGLYNTYAGFHHLGKRDAEADSQYFYSAGVYNNGYNGYIPKVYNNVASPVYNGVYNSVYNGVYNGLYNTYSDVHHIGKRDAEADSQWVFNNGYTPYAGYTGYSGFTGYTAPYNYGNVWNRAQYMW